MIWVYNLCGGIAGTLAAVIGHKLFANKLKASPSTSNSKDEKEFKDSRELLDINDSNSTSKEHMSPPPAPQTSQKPAAVIVNTNPFEGDDEETTSTNPFV